MELERNTQRLDRWTNLLDTTLFQEETQESIVPDACPDVGRILDVEAFVTLHDKETGQGHWSGRGEVCCQMVYLPEGETVPRHMEAKLPYTVSGDGADITSACQVRVIPRCMGADARLLNPRKVLFRVSLAVEVAVFAPEELSLCVEALPQEEQQVEQRWEDLELETFAALEEKPFTFSDQLHLANGRPEAQELLKTRVCLTGSESKIIGTKLIFKGEATLTVLYRSTEGTVCAANYNLPYSQIMEVQGAEEEARCALDIVTTGLECTLEDSRLLSVTLTLLAQAVVRQSRKLRVLADAYSTRYALECRREPYRFHRLAGEGEERLSVRDLVETDSAVREVLDLRLALGAVTQTREGNQVTMEAQTTVRALYLGEDGSLGVAEKAASASWSVDVGAHNCDCQFWCRLGADGYATPTVGGLEVRCPLDVSYLALESAQGAAIVGLDLDTDTPRDTAGAPSIVLRRLGPGECLWDVAKERGTTVADILQANALTEEGDLGAGLLLLPKKR